MDLRLALQAAIALTALSLLLYGTSDYLNGLMGMKESILDSPWQMLALANGFALLLGIAWPHVRGVKNGDRVLAFVQRRNEMLGTFMDGMAATALSNGRTGSRIRVRLMDGSVGEGVVTGYAGLLTPATLRIVEAERRLLAGPEGNGPETRGF
jgi:hypothetical protein